MRKKVEPLNVPAEAFQAVATVQRCLGRSLHAISLNGSAVAGGLRPHSDVDLIASIDQPMTAAARAQMAMELMAISGRHPADPGGPRPLEVIVFLRSDLKPPAYPARSEFVYGEWLREAFEAGMVPEPQSDPEFTLLLAQARRAATSLMGPEPAEWLPNIPKDDILKATEDGLAPLLASLEGDERNVLLTLVRMWRWLEMEDFVPKDVAADWAIPRLPPVTAEMVARARRAYLGMERDQWHAHEQKVRQAVNHLSRTVTDGLKPDR